MSKKKKGQNSKSASPINKVGYRPSDSSEKFGAKSGFPTVAARSSIVNRRTNTTDYNKHLK